MNDKTYNEEAAKAIAVAYAGYKTVRIADLDEADDVMHALMMIDYLRITQRRLDIEMVPQVDLYKKYARLQRLLNVYNS